MSFIKESIEVVRPAEYARSQRSGPRRARTSRSTRSLTSCTVLSTTVAPARSVTASRAPRIRAAQMSSPPRRGRGGQGHQRVRERVLVVKISDMRQAFAQQDNRVGGVPAPHGQVGTNRQRQRQEPGTGLSKDRGSLLEQTLRMTGIAFGQVDPRQPVQRIPGAPGSRQRTEPFNTSGKPIPSGHPCSQRRVLHSQRDSRPARPNPSDRRVGRSPGRARPRCVRRRVLLG